MSRVLIVGSANFDLVWRTRRLPVRGETVIGTHFATFPGGKGANQAVAAGKLGANVFFCGSVGADSFGDSLIASLQSANVDTTWVRRSELPTGSASVIVEEDSGANQIVVALGANYDLSADHVSAAMTAIQPDYVLAQCEIPIAAIEAASQTQGKFLLNPAPAVALPDSLLARCEAILPNETELSVIAGSASILLVKGAKNVILTQGAEGVTWFSGERQDSIPTHKVDAVDTVAAGDVFCGAFVTALSEGKDFRSAIQFANAAAAISVTRHGAQASAPTRAEVEAMLLR